MKYLIVLINLCIAMTSVSAQEYINQDQQFAVSSIYGRSVTDIGLDTALTLSEINPRFDSGWVKEYLSVDISVISDGKVVTESGPCDNLTSAQLELLQKADLYTAIRAHVRYIPDNTLAIREEKELDFDVTIVPGKQPQCKGGYDSLYEYLIESAIDELGPKWQEQGHYTNIEFTVDADGQIVDGKIADSTAPTAIQEKLLESVCKMEPWQAAELSGGAKVPQVLKITIGNQIGSCSIRGLMY